MPDSGYWLRSAGFGAAAGWAMMIFIMILSYAADMGFWFPLKTVAAAQVGVRALIGGDAAVVIGAVVHTSVSLFLGLVFGLLTRRLATLSEILLAGLLFGIGSWAAMTYLVLPFGNLPMLGRIQFVEGWWFVAHLIFGSVVGLQRPVKKRAVQVVREVELRSTG